MNKLRIITRADLLPGAQAAQAVHGAIAFAAAHPSLTKAWMRESNTVVLLVVPDGKALNALLRQAQAKQLNHALFVEPDMRHALTCIALAPGEKARELCANLPLALRQPVEA